jgi:ribosomal protein S18 acetylase RimI-like enzyme
VSAAGDGITIRAACGGTDLDAVRCLFEEYAASLDVDLGFQGFADELAGLPGRYAAPQGVLLLALLHGQPSGCVGVRPLEWPQVAELKRLYVRPRGRGHRLGERLSRAAMGFAGNAGYRRLRLDTLPSMASAQRLYQALGFREIDAYRFNPVPGTRYMEYVLDR